MELTSSRRYQAAEAIPIRQSTFGSKHQFRSHRFNCSSKGLQRLLKALLSPYLPQSHIFVKTTRRPYLLVRPLCGGGLSGGSWKHMRVALDFLSSHRDITFVCTYVAIPVAPAEAEIQRIDRGGPPLFGQMTGCRQSVYLSPVVTQ